jgi:hypothetical protein
MASIESVAAKMIVAEKSVAAKRYGAKTSQNGSITAPPAAARMRVCACRTRRASQRGEKRGIESGESGSGES